MWACTCKMNTLRGGAGLTSPFLLRTECSEETVGIHAYCKCRRFSRAHVRVCILLVCHVGYRVQIQVYSIKLLERNTSPEQVRHCHKEHSGADVFSSCLRPSPQEWKHRATVLKKAPVVGVIRERPAAAAEQSPSSGRQAGVSSIERPIFSSPVWERAHVSRTVMSRRAG